MVGGAALYIRFVKGWRFSDLMYVTRSSLSSMTESMKSGERGRLQGSLSGLHLVLALQQAAAVAMHALSRRLSCLTDTPHSRAPTHSPCLSPPVCCTATATTVPCLQAWSR